MKHITETDLNGIPLVAGQVAGEILEWNGVNWINADAAAKGSGTLNYISKWTPNGTTLGNSQLFDNGSYVGVNNASPNTKFDISETNNTTANSGVLKLRNTGSGVNYTETAILFNSSLNGNADFIAGRIYAKYDSASASDCRITLQSLDNTNTPVDTLSVKNGDVGIGTLNPAHFTDVVKAQNDVTTVNITNSNAGISSSERFRLFNGTSSTVLQHFGTGYTTANANFQNGALLSTNGVGGMSVVSSNAAGDLRFYVGDATTIKARILASNGYLGVGVSPTATGHFKGINNNQSTFSLKAEDLAGNIWLGVDNAGYIYSGSILSIYAKVSIDNNLINFTNQYRNSFTSGLNLANIYTELSGTGANLVDIQSGITGSTANTSVNYYAGNTPSAAGQSVGFYLENSTGATNKMGIIIAPTGVRSGFGLGNAASTIPTYPGATIEIKGEGATSATFGLKAQNSAGVLSLQVRDDGSVYNYGGGSIASNTAFGDNALVANTTAVRNTAFGVDALLLTTTGGENTAIGWKALAANTTGAGNIAIGIQAHNSNTTGALNIAIGYTAMSSSTTSSNNIAIGYTALNANTTGGKNIGIGELTNGSATTAVECTAVGFHALRSNTGNSNTAYGYRSSWTNSTGVLNNTFGYETLFDNSTGSYNTAVGGYGGYKNTTGSSNVYIGYYAGFYNTTNSNRLFINNQNRTNISGDETKSLVYGVFDAAVANQELHINAAHINVDDLPTGRASVNVGELFVDTAANILAAGDLVVARKV